MSTRKKTMPIEEPIGLRIRKYRLERGLTPAQLAEDAGLSKSYLSELESDETSNRRPSADALYRIARSLGVAISDLLGRPITLVSKSDRPKSLTAFATTRGLPETDIEMLASIRFRGDQPQTVERWAFIYDAIRNSKPMDKG